MAAPRRNAMLRKQCQEDIRAKIQTTQLVKRLTSFALGGKDHTTKEPIDMSTAQVTAALGVLRKALPDLASTEHSGEISNPASELYQRVAGITASKAERDSDSDPDSVH